MTTATKEEINRYGFTSLEVEPGSPDDSGIRWLEEPKIMIVARPEKGDRFRISRARDTKGRYLDPENNPRVFEYNPRLSDLFPILEDERWTGVDRTTKGMLIELANSPPKADTTDLLDRLFTRIQTYREPIRTQLELEFDMAAQAQFHEPTRKSYLEYLNP